MNPLKWLGSFVSGMMGTDKAANIALDIIANKAGLNDMNSKDKTEFILAYMAATKHQSPVRRFLAVMVSVIWAMLVVFWGLLALIGNIFDVEGAISTAGLYFTMIKEISPWFGGVMMFYFANGAINSIKSK